MQTWIHRQSVEWAVECRLWDADECLFIDFEKRSNIQKRPLLFPTDAFEGGNCEKPAQYEKDKIDISTRQCILLHVNQNNVKNTRNTL